MFIELSETHFKTNKTKQKNKNKNKTKQNKKKKRMSIFVTFLDIKLSLLNRVGNNLELVVKRVEYACTLLTK